MHLLPVRRLRLVHLVQLVREAARRHHAGAEHLVGLRAALLDLPLRALLDPRLRLARPRLQRAALEKDRVVPRRVGRDGEEGGADALHLAHLVDVLHERAHLELAAVGRARAERAVRAQVDDRAERLGRDVRVDEDAPHVVELAEREVLYPPPRRALQHPLRRRLVGHLGAPQRDARVLQLRQLEVEEHEVRLLEEPLVKLREEALLLLQVRLRRRLHLPQPLRRRHPVRHVHLVVLVLVVLLQVLVLVAVVLVLGVARRERRHRGGGRHRRCWRLRVEARLHFLERRGEKKVGGGADVVAVHLEDGGERRRRRGREDGAELVHREQQERRQVGEAAEVAAGRAWPGSSPAAERRPTPNSSSFGRPSHSHVPLARAAARGGGGAALGGSNKYPICSSPASGTRACASSPRSAAAARRRRRAGAE